MSALPEGVRRLILAWISIEIGVLAVVIVEALS